MRIAFQLLFRAPIRSDLDAEIDRPDLISFEAEIDVIRSAVPYLPKRVLHERALAGLTFITLQVAERARASSTTSPGEPLLDEEAFIANLVDMTTALAHRAGLRDSERGVTSGLRIHGRVYSAERQIAPMNRGAVG